MKYLLLIYMTENAIDESRREACYVKSNELAQDLVKKGQFLARNPLHPVSTATTVRVREGKRMITDGPFAETREYLGGYFLIEAGDLDTAIDIASRIPAATFGTVEIRPVIEILGIPKAAVG